MPDKLSIYDVGDRYDMSESENEYDEREKKLLRNIRSGKKSRRDEEEDEEVLGFDEDEGDYDDDEEDDFDDDEIRKFEHDSDIEDKEDDGDDLPDRKAWGSKARAFYGADYVDQDYDSLTAQEEERARLEELEAKEIQQRLAKELNEADFSLDLFVPQEEEVEVEEKKKSKKKKDKTEIKLKADLSDLSDRQKRELFRKEAPEFDGLVEDFARNLEECHEVLEPVLEYLKDKGIGDHPFVELLSTKYKLGLSYCNNISFYLLLKSKKIKVKNHPVVKRMVQMKQLLLELEQKYENSIKSQVEELLGYIAAGDELVFDEEQNVAVAEKPRKKKLSMLEDMEDGGGVAEDQSGDEEELEDSGSESDEPSAKKVRMDESDSEEEQEHAEEMVQDEDEEEAKEGDRKRKITYQMAKNKGLTVRKKKDQRNIRVKNRRKFQKAIVRRKGTVRSVRTETTRYAGEATGIKAFIKRSIKIK